MPRLTLAKVIQKAIECHPDLSLRRSSVGGSYLLEFYVDNNRITVARKGTLAEIIELLNTQGWMRGQYSELPEVAQEAVEAPETEEAKEIRQFWEALDTYEIEAILTDPHATFKDCYVAHQIVYSELDPGGLRVGTHTSAHIGLTWADGWKNQPLPDHYLAHVDRLGELLARA